MSSIPPVSSSAYVPKPLPVQAPAPRPADSDGDHDGSKGPAAGGASGRRLDVTA